jgi:tripartite motif-containing protein 71
VSRLAYFMMHPSKRRAAAIVVFLLLVLIWLVALLILMLRQEPVEGEYRALGRLKPLHVLIGPGVGERPFFEKPMGVAFGKGDRVYVADTGNNRICVFDRNGRYLFQFGGLGVGKPAPQGVVSWKPGLFNYPTDVAVDSDGNLYVADFRNDQIQVFDPEGKFLRVFPDRNRVVGRGASGYNGRGIAVSSVTVRDDRVYATDRYQVVVFDTKGNLLEQWGMPGDGPGELDHPNGVAVDLNYEVFICDSNHSRVSAYSPAGRPLWSVGKPVGDVTKQNGGQFEVPRAITFMQDRSILVVDALASKLVRLTVTGEVDGEFGQRGDRPGELNFPTDVDSRESRIAVAEKGNNRVQVMLLESE